MPSLAQSPVTLRSNTAQASPSRTVLLLFLICIFMPIAKEVAGLRLSPSRLMLLVLILPLAVKCMAGKFGRFTLVDGLMLAHGLWISLALIMVHGTERIPFAGITSVELVGGYFVGRAYVRSAEDYRWVFRTIFTVFLLLLPFALIENLTAKLIIPDLFRAVFDTPTRDASARGRMGLERVQGVFDHPILWGLFCALAFSNFVMSLQGSMSKRLMGIGLSIWLTMMSLSSGPLLAILLQVGLLSWNKIMKGRWLVLLVLAAIAYVLIDLLSNRTPIRILISIATFNTLSAFTRLAQFEAGMASVLSNPLFGIGFNSWPKPDWVNDSIDNFWLLTAMRYGAVAVLILIAAYVMHLWSAARAKIADPAIQATRIGHLVAFVALAFVLMTVHIWGNMSIFAMFYLGAGGWLYTSPQLAEQDSDEDGADDSAPPGPVYSRFAHHQGRHPNRISAADAPAPSQPLSRVSARPPQELRRR